MSARRLTVTVLVSLCTLVGMLGLSLASASAAVLPEVTIQGFGATNLTPTTAAVKGTVNPEGVPVTACEFVYGPDLEGVVQFSQSVPCSPSPGSGNTAVSVSATLTGLEPSGLYFYRLSATNANGTSQTPEESGYFFVPPAVEGVSTGSAEELSNSAAKLTGSLTPDGTDAHYYFEYGTTEAYGSKSPALPGTDAGTGGSECKPPGGAKCSPAAAATTIGSLAENTTYHYRLVAVNSIGTTHGSDRQFRTFGLPQVQAEAEVKAAEQAGQTSATLQAKIDPEGPETTYRFEYSETTGYGTSVPVPDGTVAAGQELVSVPAAVVSNLKIGTTYHYRVVASNVYGTTKGPDQQFKTLPALLIEQESAAEVSAASASLRARINPLGYDTHYYFQYGVTGYTSSVPAPPGIDLGSGEVSLPVSVHLQGLVAGTVYHYRVVAVNEAGGEPMTVEGSDQTFATQAAGTETTQPDGRQWEMVSPPSKQGASIIAIGFEPGAEIQASAEGGAIAYTASGPFVANPAGSRSIEATQVASVRHAPGSWGTADITTRNNEKVAGVAVGHSAEYKLFSTDLSLGFVEPVGCTPLAPLPPNMGSTVYLRALSGEFTTLVSPANTAPGVEFECGKGYPVGFSGASPDLSHVVLRSGVKLTAAPTPAPADTGDFVYEWADGQLQPASVLPNNEFAESATLGTRENNVRNAVSTDGSRIVFGATVKRAHGSGVNNLLYMRDMVRKETVQVDAAQGTPEVESRFETRFRTASSNDSRVFFTSGNRLTANATAPGLTEDLYVFEVTSGKSEPFAGKLTDLTVDGNAEEAAPVRGVIGASEDGSLLYFVANGVLGDGAEHGAAPGGNNLYVERYDAEAKAWAAPKLIAVLANGDEPSWEDQAGGSLAKMTARVSPDGQYLTFMSERSLTGYENRDASSSEPDEEVFLYNASTGRTVCASCDPTGARPVGFEEPREVFSNLADWGQIWMNRWLAAEIPAWTNDELGIAKYQSRFLSDSGRLFFDSPDALVPADVNGKQDVYEYEPVGVGSCQAPSYGRSASVVFDEGIGGCVALISAGTSSEESAFMDASETGGDVFFLTLSKLSPEDVDNSLDIYDAHECTASEPCAPPAPLTPPPCTTGDACKPGPTPQPALFGEPSSETFSGAGNIVPSGSETKVTSRSAGNAQKLAKALKACRKKPKRKRAGCERQARVKYGAKQSRAGKGLSARTRR
jgi:hypothetical protein